jgi:hypothetical protein
MQVIINGFRERLVAETTGAWRQGLGGIGVELLKGGVLSM